ncbi:MAG: hypothetical protein K8T25_19440 [Planctomycetia bacterium]|nr:hypothetical protein [Planctomycetia bacterium]
MQVSRWSLAVLFAANVVCLTVLGFYGTTAAQTSNPATPPFANSVAQRMELVEQLKETNRLLREQNDLLQSGRLRVMINKEAP